MNHSHARCAFSIVSILAAAGAAASARAQSWDGGGANDNWTTANNWNPNGVPVNDGTANVAFRGSTRLAPVVSGAVNVNAIGFLSPAGSFDINPGAFRFFLQIGAGGVINSDNSLQQISNPISLTASQTWTASSGPLDINAVDGEGHVLTITGGFDTTIARHTGTGSAIVKNGAGSLLLTSNSSSNGGITINAGDVRVDADSRLGGNDILINDGGALIATADFTSTRDITLAGAAALFDTQTHQLALDAGLLAVNSGEVVSPSGFIGLGLPSDAQADVNGPDSTWTMPGSFAVGYQDQGTLTIRSGGGVSCGITHVGSLPGSNGLATITGPGSTWTSSGFLGVGYSGTGTMNVENGGSVSSESSFVATEPGSVGNVSVVGPGSTWSVVGAPIVGEHGTGTLTIADGGLVTGSGGFVGRYSDGVGAATITDPGSIWNNDGTLLIGDSGTGALDILAGAHATVTGYAMIGQGADSDGRVTVTGAGSAWDIAQELFVGFVGTGALIIADGATVTNGDASIGKNVSPRGGDAAVRNAATWTNADLSVGDGGSGTLTIESAGLVDSLNCEIGSLVDGSGAVTVSGAGSTWNNQNVSVGYLGGDGELTIEAGGRVVSGNASVGGFSGVGTAIVTGAGSRWDSPGAITAGFFGQGSLLIDQGASVTATLLAVGFGTGASGDATIDGDGSSLAVAFELQLSASDAHSSLDLLGGIVTVSGNITDGGAGLSSLTLDGATLDVLSHAIGTGSPIDNLAFRSGTLRNVTGINNGAGLAKSGSGTLVLDTANSYAGPTAVSAGTLRVANASGSATGAGAVAIAPGAALAGTGAINGPVSSDGTVSPGVSPGILTLRGGYTQHATGTLEIEIAGRSPGSQHDRLAITGAAALDGTLNVTLLNGFEPVVGDAFDILTATTRNGGFAVINAPTLPSPKVWRVEYLPGAVRLHVACPADFDGNGVLNVFDFLAFQSAFSTNDPAADFNDDGNFNVFDFLLFQTGLSDGC